MAKFRYTYDPNQPRAENPPAFAGPGYLGSWYIGQARNERYAERGTGGITFSTTPGFQGTATIGSDNIYSLAETFSVGDQIVIAQYNQFGVLHFVKTERVTAAVLQVDPLNQIAVTIENNNQEWLAEGTVHIWKAGLYYPFYIDGNYMGEWDWHTDATVYTELGRWNDTASDYRTANDADYTNFGGVSWCANRGPLNNVADPFPLNSTTTYRLRFVQGGGATQASAEVIGTPTQAHIDSSPGGGIACYRFGTAADMTAAFGNPESNPNSPARFNGGTWILERQELGVNVVYPEVARWRPTLAAVAQSARYVHTTGMIVASDTTLHGTFPSTLTGNWRLSQVGGATITGPLTLIDDTGPNKSFRVGSQSQMIAAFGNLEIASGGDFVLEQQIINDVPIHSVGILNSKLRFHKQPNATWEEVLAPATNTWSPTATYALNELVRWNGKNYKALRVVSAGEPNPEYDVLRSGTLDTEQFQLSLGPHPTPPADTTNWSMIAGWNGFSAYAVNDLASHNGILYRCLTAQTVPGVAPQTINISTQLTEQARWNAAGNAGANGNAFYNSATFNGNANPLSGTVPASNPGGTWTLRQVGGGTITGSINQWSNLGTSFQIRITSQAAMQTAFGTSFIGGGGQWILERQATTTGTINITSNGVVATQIALLGSSLQVTTTSSLANKQIVISAGTETITFAAGQSSHTLNASQSSAVSGATSIQFSVQASPPAQNTAPGGGNTAWETVTTVTWSGIAPYNQGTLVNFGIPSVFFRALNAITVGTPMSPTDYTLVFKPSIGTTISGTFTLTGVDANHFEFDIPTFSGAGTTYFNGLTAGTKIELFPGVERKLTWGGRPGDLQYSYVPVANVPMTSYQLEKGTSVGYVWKLRSAQANGEHYLTWDSGDIGATADGRKPGKDITGLIYPFVLPRPWGLFGAGNFLAVANVLRLFVYDRTTKWRDFDKEFNFHSIVNMNATGYWANQTTAYVLDYTSRRVYAYVVSTGARDPAKDITLDAAHTRPYGMDSDGTTLWIGQATSSAKLFAYTLSNGARDATRDVNTLAAAGNTAPSDVLVDGNDLYVSDFADAKIYAYNLTTKLRIPAKDFDNLGSYGNGRISGIWANADTMYVLDNFQSAIFAYNKTTKARDFSKDVNNKHFSDTGNSYPTGMYQDGTTMWIADAINGKIYAYRLSDSFKDRDKDYNTLEAANNLRPTGLWREGNTMYVANQGIIPIGYIGRYNGETFSSTNLPGRYGCLGQNGLYRFALYSEDGNRVRTVGTGEAKRWFTTGDPITLFVNNVRHAGTVTSASITGTQATVTVSGISVTINPNDLVEVWNRQNVPFEVLQAGSLGGIKIYAYNHNTKAREPQNDINTLEEAQNYKPNGIALTASFWYVVDEVKNKIFCYAHQTGARDTTREINNLDIGANGAPKGLYTDGTTLWVVDRNPPRGEAISNVLITGINTDDDPNTTLTGENGDGLPGGGNTGTGTTAAQQETSFPTPTGPHPPGTTGVQTSTAPTSTAIPRGNVTEQLANVQEEEVEEEDTNVAVSRQNNSFPTSTGPHPPGRPANEAVRSTPVDIPFEIFELGPEPAPAQEVPAVQGWTPSLDAFTTPALVSRNQRAAVTTGAIAGAVTAIGGAAIASGTTGVVASGVYVGTAVLAAPFVGVALLAGVVVGGVGYLGYNALQERGVVGDHRPDFNPARYFGGYDTYGSGGNDGDHGGAPGASDGFGGDARGCFEEGTLMRMADGSLKPIEQIQPGDVMKQGGRVLCVMRGNGLMEKWFNYCGVICTADQRVFEEDGWRRVEDSKHSTPVEQRLYYYDTMNEFHRQEHASGLLFTDFQGAHVVETNNAK